VEAQQLFGDQVRFVGVPGLANEGSMVEFVADTGTGVIDHIPDPDGEIWDRFGVIQQRTYVYVNDDGSWQTSGYGSLHSDVEELIAR
jgi:hypothetical protein